MSWVKAQKPGRILAILSVIILVVGASAYFYKDALNIHQKGPGSIVVSKGLTKIGKDIMISAGTANRPW